jgi:hypothetical protein
MTTNDADVLALAERAEKMAAEIVQRCREGSYGAIEVMEDLMEFRALSRPVPEWRPIDTAPKDGTRIDVWLSGGRIPDVYWGLPRHDCGEAGAYCDSCPVGEGWCDAYGYLTEDEQPTHWMPLPAALSEREDR